MRVWAPFYLFIYEHKTNVVFGNYGVFFAIVSLFLDFLFGLFDWLEIFAIFVDFFKLVKKSIVDGDVR